MYRRNTVSTFLHRLWELGCVNLILLLDLAGDVAYLMKNFHFFVFYNVARKLHSEVLNDFQCMGECRRKASSSTFLHSSWQRECANLIMLPNLAGDMNYKAYRKPSYHGLQLYLHSEVLIIPMYGRL